MVYKLLLYTHVMSAILSIGPFFVLIPLLKQLRAASNENLISAYLSVFTAAIRLVKHAGHVLVISGILLIIQGPWPWTTSWIVMTIAVMICSTFFLARAFSPTLKEFNQAEYNQHTLVMKLQRAVWLYIFLLMLMLWFMVAKPLLW